MILVRNIKYASRRNLDLILKLSQDPVPSVRYQIIRRSHYLFKTAKSDMWKLIEKFSREEKTNGNLAATAVVLESLAGIETDRVLDLFEVIESRQHIQDRKKAGTHNDPIVSTVTELYLVRNNQRAKERLGVYLQDAVKFYEEITDAAITSINYLIIKDDSKVKAKEDEIKGRTRELILSILQSACIGLKKLANAEKGDDTQKIMREVYHAIEIIGRWVYFNSDEEKKQLTSDDLKKYYFEVKPILEKVIQVGQEITFLSPSTVHYLVQFCNRALQCDPQGVIKIAHDLCMLPSGYPSDSFALGEVKKLIETSVVDHKEALRNQETMKYMMQIINSFVKAGWNEAIELSLKLDEVWR